MAEVASVAARDVVNRFALCVAAVMTAETCAEHHTVVHVRDRRPGSCAVAIITTARSRDVIGWYASRGHLSASRVAGTTLSWCAFKNTADMAAFAFNACMGPREYKTSFEMIESKLLMFGGSGLQCQENASTEHYEAYYPQNR